MKDYLKGSSLRVCMFIALFSCIGMAYLGILLDRDLPGLSMVIGVILGAIFVTKGVQKFAERNE